MKKYEHKGAEWLFPFIEYAPDNTDEALPLIIQLHGAGERGDGSVLCDVEWHGFSELLKTKNYPVRVVMPQCPVDTFWAARVESILKFIDQITDKYKTDKNRIYLTGLSMGGFGTWYTAMAAPDKFAAIAPVCGGGMDWNAHTLKMPIWTFHGADDDLVSPAYTEMMVAALQKRGADVKYTRFDGVGHNAWDYTYGDELMNWLLSHSK